MTKTIALIAAFASHADNNVGADKKVSFATAYVSKRKPPAGFETMAATPKYLAFATEMYDYQCGLRDVMSDAFVAAAHKQYMTRLVMAFVGRQ